MLGPEASLYVKLLTEDRLLELLEETAKELATPTDSSPCIAAAAATSTVDLRALQWTKLDCVDTTRTSTANTNQRLLTDLVALLFLIAISIFSSFPLRYGWSMRGLCYCFYIYIGASSLLWTVPLFGLRSGTFTGSCDWAFFLVG